MGVHKFHPKAATIADRHKWILQYIRDNGPASYTDEPFITAYAEATGVVFKPELKGSARCRALAQDLATMIEDGRLNGVRKGGAGIGNGSPYVYSLATESAR